MNLKKILSDVQILPYTNSNGTVIKILKIPRKRNEVYCIQESLKLMLNLIKS